MGAVIHPTAIVESGARLGADVRIGPCSVVGPQVELGDAVELVSHVVVAGRTRIGARTRLYPFASIGHAPQDQKYRGEPSRLVIGADCTIREGVTINPGTEGGGMETAVGDSCLMMANAHVAHDCRLGAHVVLSNNVMLAGHVTIGDHAVLGGGVGVHQFVRIGEQAFVGGLSGLEGDLVPFGLAFGNRARLAGLNLIGLRRRGVPRESVAALSDAYDMLFASEGLMADRLAALKDRAHDPFVARLVAFLAAGSDRPLCRPSSSEDAPAALP
jgi:UDP-N-acetylglucosamine acyltransferase